MLINGEKYACDACIRGHRVSSCQHHDRPLSHINRKGRPVSQCPHCRGLRKTKTSHVSCQCGEKPHNKSDCKNNEKGTRKQCCCGHGSRCICTAKRDSNLATVPEIGPAPIQKSTFQAKQLHMPGAKIDTSASAHRAKVKHNNTSKRAHPYPLPRSHTLHSPADLARRSADNLPLSEEMGISRSVPAHPDSVTSAPRDIRRVKSEHGSPVISFTRLDTQIPPIEIPYSTYDQASLPSPAFDYPQHWPLYYTDPELVAPPSLGPPSVDWSTFDLSYGSDALTATYSQPPSYTSFDYANFGHPELSRSSSHDASESDEFTSMGLSVHPPKPDGLEIRTTSDGSESEVYHLSASPSHLDMHQSRISGINHIEPLEFDLYWRISEGISQPSPLTSISLGPELPQYSSSQAFQSQQIPTPIDNGLSLDTISILSPSEPNESMWVPTTSPFPPVLSPVSMDANGHLDRNHW